VPDTTISNAVPAEIPVGVNAPEAVTGAPPLDPLICGHEPSVVPVESLIVNVTLLLEPGLAAQYTLRAVKMEPDTT
jgi:hypothetical protein